MSDNSRSLITFDNSYARLPERFFERTSPTQVHSPQLVYLNDTLFQLNLDRDRLRSADGIAMLSGSRLPENAEAIAMAYAGHQFGGGCHN